MALKWSSQLLTSGLNNQLAEGVGNLYQGLLTDTHLVDLMAGPCFIVMAGRGPAIHVLSSA
jgi:hypothetical protein